VGELLQAAAFSSKRNQRVVDASLRQDEALAQFEAGDDGWLGASQAIQAG
jgi:hypothetical protein